MGYDRVIIRPHPPTYNSTAAESQVPGHAIPSRGGTDSPGGLPWANATVVTVRGPVTAQWRYELDDPASPSRLTMRLFVELPGNVASCTVFVPNPLPFAPVVARGACAYAATFGGDDEFDEYRLDAFAGRCEFYITIALLP